MRRLAIALAAVSLLIGCDADRPPGATEAEQVHFRSADQCSAVLVKHGHVVACSPTADRRPPTADRRPPTADRRPPTAYSPAADRLLVGWQDADQWLFLPVGGGGRIETVGDISGQFDAGEPASGRSFPRVEGWCCRAG